MAIMMAPILTMMMVVMVMDSPADPNHPENDLPLLCETIPEPDFTDTISVQDKIVQEGIKNMLPYQYHSYIKFDQDGNLDNTLLQSVANNPGIQLPTIYKCLVYLTQQKVDISVQLKSKWMGITMQHPAGGSYPWVTETQGMDGITVIPGTIPLPGVPVMGNTDIGIVFIKKGIESNMEHLAFVVAHELLGHMYQYLKHLPYNHDDPEFESWAYSIEAEVRKNWKMIKKREKSKPTFP